MYNPVAPIDKPIIKNKRPSHFPKIKPAKIATGDPNPANIVQIIVNKIKVRANIKKLVCLNSKKYSLLFFIKS